MQYVICKMKDHDGVMVASAIAWMNSYEEGKRIIRRINITTDDHYILYKNDSPEAATPRESKG